MNWARIWLCFIVIYIVLFILGWIIHDMILGGYYEAAADVFRPEEEQKMVVHMVSHALFVFMLCFIFAKGYEDRGMGEGIRFGLLMWLFITIPFSIGWWAFMPIPGNLVGMWIVTGLIEWLVAGLILAWLYKESSAPAFAEPITPERPAPPPPPGPPPAPEASAEE